VKLKASGSEGILARGVDFFPRKYLIFVEFFAELRADRVILLMI